MNVINFATCDYYKFPISMSCNGRLLHPQFNRRQQYMWPSTSVLTLDSDLLQRVLYCIPFHLHDPLLQSTSPWGLIDIREISNDYRRGLGYRRVASNDICYGTYNTQNLPLNLDNAATNNMYT